MPSRGPSSRGIRPTAAESRVQALRTTRTPPDGNPDSLEVEQEAGRRLAAGEVYEVRGRRLTRPQVIEHICTELVDGRDVRGLPLDLVDLCAEPGMPSLSQVMAWMRVNRVWEEAVLEAEKARAHRLVHEARGIAREAQGAAQAAGSKLAVEALQWEAAKVNQRFADRQIVETQTSLSAMSDKDLVTQLVAALKADPEAMKLLAPELAGVIDAEILEPAVLEPRTDG